MQNGVAVAVQPRDHRLRRGPFERSRVVVAGNLDGERVGLGGAVEITDFEEPDLRAVLARNGNFFRDPELANRPRLRTEPPAMADVTGQNFALDPGALAVVQERGNIRGGIERQNLS